MRRPPGSGLADTVFLSGNHISRMCGDDMKQIFICEDHITGIFSGIYDAWKAGYLEEEAGIAVRGMIEQELFCEYRESEPAQKKALSVEQLIQKHMGMEVYQDMYYALLSQDPVKGDAVWRTMQAARRIPDSRRIMDHLSHSGVEKVFELSRSVGHEAHLFTGFVRFQELANGILYSEITPKAQVLSCIADHFADRLPQENWMIRDKTHNMYLIHQAGRQWFLLHDAPVDEALTKQYSGKEKELQRLWKGFVKSIAIAERTNPTLQRQHLALHYRRDMIDFA